MTPKPIGVVVVHPGYRNGWYIDVWVGSWPAGEPTYCETHGGAVLRALLRRLLVRLSGCQASIEYRAEATSGRVLPRSWAPDTIDGA